MRKYLWLVLAMTIEVGCYLTARALKLPQAAVMVLTIAPTMAVMFPFLRQWMPRTSYKRWFLAIASGAFFAVLLDVTLSALAGK